MFPMMKWLRGIFYKRSEFCKCSAAKLNFFILKAIIMHVAIIFFIPIKKTGANKNKLINI